MGLYIRLEAKSGMEKALEDFLRSALPLAQAEPGTPVWYAVKFGPSSFAIFDAFPNEEGRDAHLNGPIAAALTKSADELLASPPAIERWDLLAAK
jgi:quinol monooxygenase YgiN